MSDPRNNAPTPPESVDWTEPDPEVTGRFREMIDLHRIDRREYLRKVRGEQIEVSVDEFGCEIVTDTTGEYEQITVECPEDDA